MIVAGEASGDAHATSLIKALRDHSAGVELDFFGAAGPQMRAAGVEPVVSSDDLAIVGVAEIARALPMFWNSFQQLKKAAIVKKPDVVILVDFPEFNLKLAKVLKKQGFRVVYYISPQLWAWRKYRVSAVRKYVNLMLTILPFEKEWYARHGVENVEYVGNPLANEVHSTSRKEEFCRVNNLKTTDPIVAFLPGSRQTEISHILPDMLAAAKLIVSEKPEVQFVIPAASIKARKSIDAIIEKTKPTATLRVVEKSTYDALSASDAAAVTSGTATLETGIIGTPLAIVYKGSSLNYALLRPLINVEHFGLINLIAGRRIATELIQGHFTPSALASELLRLLEPSNNLHARRELRVAAEKLGTGGASSNAAAAILRLLD